MENVSRITELLKLSLREKDKCDQPFGNMEEQVRRVQIYLLKELCRDGWTEEARRDLMRVTMNDLANLDTITQVLLQAVRDELGKVSEKIGEGIPR